LGSRDQKASVLHELKIPVTSNGEGGRIRAVNALDRENILLRQLLEQKAEISRALEAERNFLRQQVAALLPSPRRPWWRFWR
jgi:hypothetical protein